MTIYILIKTTVWNCKRVAKRAIEISEEVLAICDEAKYTSKITLMQSLTKKLSATGRRNVVVEADLDGDECIAALIFLLIGAKESGNPATVTRPSRIMLVPAEQLPMVQAFIAGLHSLRDSGQFPIVIGLNPDAKEDLALLHGSTSVLISTPRRLIDHIRRKNIVIDRTRLICLVRPSDTHDSERIDSYDSDLMYIHAKLGKKVKTILFTSQKEKLPSSDDILNRPKIITMDDLSTAAEAVYYQVPQLTPSVISDYIYANKMNNVQIVCLQKALYTSTKAYMESQHILYSVSVTSISDSHAIPQTVQHVIFAGRPESPSFLHSTAPSSREKHHFIIDAQEGYILPYIQENYTMSKQFTTPEADEILSGKIKLLIEEIEKDSNPDELNDLKRKIRKQVPFYRRGYLTAFLLREYLKGGQHSSQKRSRVQMDLEDTATLFFGVGKNRRTYPKDIARLLREEAGLQNSEIASIKTLDNYSFVSVAKDKADVAIERLNGKKYKGRVLVVNFAKSRAK